MNEPVIPDLQTLREKIKGAMDMLNESDPADVLAAYESWWHRKTFCYTCSACGSAIFVGDHYFTPGYGEILCSGCVEHRVADYDDTAEPRRLLQDS